MNKYCLIVLYLIEYLIKMFQIDQFKENIYIHRVWCNNYGICPLCYNAQNHSNHNNYGNYSNIMFVALRYDNGKKTRGLDYCLRCQTFFSRSHKFEDNDSTGDYGNIYHVFLISEFKYENKVVVGTPYFNSLSELIRGIQQNKFQSLTFTCSCANNPSSSKARYPEKFYPKYYDKCTKSFTLNDIIEICIDNNVTIPSSTKPAIK